MSSHGTGQGSAARPSVRGDRRLSRHVPLRPIQDRRPPARPRRMPRWHIDAMAEADRDPGIGAARPARSVDGTGRQGRKAIESSTRLANQLITGDDGVSRHVSAPADQRRRRWPPEPPGSRSHRPDWPRAARVPRDLDSSRPPCADAEDHLGAVRGSGPLPDEVGQKARKKREK